MTDNDGNTLVPTKALKEMQSEMRRLTAQLKIAKEGLEIYRLMDLDTNAVDCGSIARNKLTQINELEMK